MGVFTELEITHLIPKERVSDDYFLWLLESTQLRVLMLNHKWGRVFPPSPYTVRGITSLLKTFVVCRRFERQATLAFLRGTHAARRALSGLA
jgi:hypothetical protein